MGHLHGSRIHERFELREVGGDRALGSLVDAAHEWKRELVSDEVPSTELDSTPVKRSLVWKLAVQVDPIVVAHDVEERLSQTLQRGERLTPVGLLSRFDSLEAIRESEEIPRKDYRKGLSFSSDIDEPSVDVVPSVDIRSRQDSHGIARSDSTTSIDRIQPQDDLPWRIESEVDRWGRRRSGMLNGRSFGRTCTNLRSGPGRDIIRVCE